MRLRGILDLIDVRNLPLIATYPMEAVFEGTSSGYG